MRPRKTDRHLPPCVYHRHGSYWLVKRGKWTRLGHTLPAALAAYGRSIDEATGEMPTLIDDAMTATILPGKAPATAAQYKIAARKLKRIFADRSPTEVMPRDIAQVRLSYASIPNMANRMLTVLRMVFDYALELEKVDINPCVGLRRLAERKRRRYLTDEEFRAIYKLAGDRLQITMDLLYLTAQRPVDVLKIRRADVTDDGILFVQQKTDARLLVAMSPPLKAVIDRAKALAGNVPALTLLFGQKRRPVNYESVALQWRTACEKAKIEDAQLRDIRAKALTDAKIQGLDPQVLAGHVSPAMTERYIRLRQTPVATSPTFGQRPILKQIGEQNQ